MILKVVSNNLLILLIAVLNDIPLHFSNLGDTCIYPTWIRVYREDPITIE